MNKPRMSVDKLKGYSSAAPNNEECKLNSMDPEKLLQYRNNDGGMPYAPGMPSFSEATILAILALIATDAKNAARPLLDWILKNRNPDGSIGLNPEFPKDGLWNTPLLAIAAHHLGLMPERDAAIEYILKVRSLRLERTPENDLNTELIGWSWIPNTFGWVEPTSWALLALSIAGRSDHLRAVEARLLLEDRCIPEGGWNYGNKVVFNHTLMPFWDTTALAIMAIGVNNKTTLNRNLDFLERSLPEIRSLYSSAIVCICLERFGRKTGALTEQISAFLEDKETATLNLAHTAMGIIALAKRRVLTP